MPDYKHAIIIILVMGITTLLTRWIPPAIFSHGDTVPDYIMYLGKVMPYTAMGLLIVYCLKDVSVISSPHGLPELISLAIVSATYIWKRNSILSVIIGTVLYMVLVQMVF